MWADPKSQINFWSQLKQMEVEFYKMKDALASSTSELRESMRDMFDTLEQVRGIGEGSEENMNEPRSS